MKPDTFVKLALAATATLALALSAYALNNRWDAGTVQGERLLPGLEGLGSRIARVIVSQGGSTLSLVGKPAADGKGMPTWTIAERDGYPADADKVRALILRLAKAEKIEAKTAKADRHAALEVEDPTAAGAKSRLVRVLDEKGTALAEVVVGKKRWDAFGTGQSGTYVRRATEARTWLVNADIEPAGEVRQWIATDVLRLAAETVERVEIAPAGEAPLTIERRDGKVQFTGVLVEGEKLKDETAADSIVRGLASIDAEDVRKRTAQPAAAAPAAAAPAGSAPTQPASLKAKLSTGLEVTLAVRRDGEHAWVAIDAVGSGDAKAAADAINARTAGWEFRVPAFKADQMVKSRADLVEAKAG